mmetsp:Transcript_61467/g.70477  ORF Transcript_61467/g.70477 Transcript_61467/m.70477 type:complete len:312 (+) Transcript_61467:2528-3463(+)
MLLQVGISLLDGLLQTATVLNNFDQRRTIMSIQDHTGDLASSVAIQRMGFFINLVTHIVLEFVIGHIGKTGGIVGSLFLSTGDGSLGSGGNLLFVMRTDISDTVTNFVVSVSTTSVTGITSVTGTSTVSTSAISSISRMMHGSRSQEIMRNKLESLVVISGVEGEIGSKRSRSVLHGISGKVTHGSATDAHTVATERNLASILLFTRSLNLSLGESDKHDISFNISLIHLLSGAIGINFVLEADKSEFGLDLGSVFTLLDTNGFNISELLEDFADISFSGLGVQIFQEQVSLFALLVHSFDFFTFNTLFVG